MVGIQLQMRGCEGHSFQILTFLICRLVLSLEASISPWLSWRRRFWELVFLSPEPDSEPGEGLSPVAGGALTASWLWEGWALLALA